MTKANKLKKKRRSNIEDDDYIEDKLQEEYRNSIKNEIEDSINQVKLEDSCFECCERMKEYILNCGLMIGQNLNCQNLLDFVKPEKKIETSVYKEYKLKFVSIKRDFKIK